MSNAGSPFTGRATQERKLAQLEEEVHLVVLVHSDSFENSRVTTP